MITYRRTRLLNDIIEACQCLKSLLNDLSTPEECMDEDSEQEELELVE